MAPDKPLPKELFKFRSFDATGRDGRDSQTVFDMLRGRIPFSTLESFNDPFEGRPYSIPAFADALEQKQALQKYLLNILIDKGKTQEAALKQVEQILSSKTTDEIVKLAGDVHIRTYADPNLLLFCASSGDALKSLLTWSHYADCHRGVCIHFDSKFLPFLPAFEIKYSDTYPAVTVPRTEAEEWDPIQKGLLWKCDLWSYEREYRVVKAPGDSLGLNWDHNIALASPKAITRISLGQRMDDKPKERLMMWAAQNAPHIEIWQARLHDRRYELEFGRIS